jgi:hypothetical protein
MPRAGGGIKVLVVSPPLQLFTNERYATEDYIINVLLIILGKTELMTVGESPWDL